MTNTARYEAAASLINPTASRDHVNNIAYIVELLVIRRDESGSPFAENALVTFNLMIDYMAKQQKEVPPFVPVMIFKVGVFQRVAVACNATHEIATFTEPTTVREVTTDLNDRIQSSMLYHWRALEATETTEPLDRLGA